MSFGFWDRIVPYQLDAEVAEKLHDFQNKSVENFLWYTDFMKIFKPKPACTHPNIQWTNIGRTTKSGECPDCGKKFPSR